jgi:hypothetical protein
MFKGGDANEFRRMNTSFGVFGNAMAGISLLYPF